MEEWQKAETIVLWIISIATFLVVLLIFMIMILRSYFKKTIQQKAKVAEDKVRHQQNILKISIQTQEKERERIAADIHDSLINKLSTLKMGADVNAITSDAMSELIGECIVTARRISHDLSPPLLEETPLREFVEEIFFSWNAVIQTAVYCDSRVETNYTADFKIQVVRILQEVTMNIIKHAKSEKIHVHMRESENGLVIHIKDFGVGFDTNNKFKGLGLKNIEARVNHLQGVYRMKSKVGEGTSTLFLFKKNTNE